MPSKRGAIVYIDGFNLYFGMCEANLRRSLWVDLCEMARRIAPADREVLEVRYYTARLPHPSTSRQRQWNFMQANQAHNPELVIVEGYMQYHDVTCRGCGDSWTRREEKQSDVNIALDIADLASRSTAPIDTVVLVSADSDLVPAVRRALAAGLEVHARFPPKRHSSELTNICTDSYSISSTKLKRSQLPESVLVDHRWIRQPAEWTSGKASDA